MSAPVHHPWSEGVWAGSPAEREDLAAFARGLDWSDVVGEIDPNDSAVRIVDDLALEIEDEGDEMHGEVADLLVAAIRVAAVRENERRRAARGT